MILSWMAYTALVTGLLTVAAAALERVATARGWPRRFVWLVALAGSMAWPIIGAVRNLLPEREPVLAFAITLPTQVIVDAASGPDRAELINRSLLVFWIAASAFLLFRLTRGVTTLRRTRRTWRSGEVDGMPVQLTPDVGPAVVGLRPMEVVLPEWIVSLDAPLRALVLCHEEEHRRARDPYFLCASAIAVALMPWNVALWVQARRLRLAIEMDCDARVLRVHPSAERYGMLMITIAQRRSVTPAFFAPMLSEPTTNLERRIVAMKTTRRLTRATMFGGTILAVAAFAFACTLKTDAVTAPNAQASQTTTSKNGPPAYFEFQVKRAAAPIPGSVPPRYPDMLRSANVEGEVLAQFIVNADSSVDMNTFKVLRSTHDLFTAAVRTSLAQMRFSPAVAGDRPVRQLLQMPFTFSVAGSPGPAAQIGAPLTSEAEVRTGQGVARARGINIEGVPRAPRTGPPQPVKETDVFFEFQVEKQVSPVPGNPAPRFPDMLRSANVEGEVLAQFVVGTDGRPVPETFKVLKSTHDLFTNAVLSGLPQMRFNAAQVGGRPVKQLVQMPFQFSLSKSSP